MFFFNKVYKHSFWNARTLFFYNPFVISLATYTPLADAWDRECVTSTSVTDHVQTFVHGLQMFIQFYFHIIELDFHTVKQSIIIGCTRAILSSVDHLDNFIQDSFRSTRLKSPGSASVGLINPSSILSSVLRLPRIRSPNLCTITPPPSILDSLAMLFRIRCRL